ncbi:GNAT family N-acetyltransferase [Thermobrachium celere]|uniref:N-acetyltransferase domain-containing protein n=1 Tax=Thermobrachium celere DSM 8682 TaxID=941824 RepID=R7RS71_9CLOT|nr:GNAT family N-acetyltransferase [Thermobrachium celere]CDF58133.1 hypothetical protein TCEL_00179 [Thermobrachium celere DSM 8682]
MIPVNIIKDDLTIRSITKNDLDNIYRLIQDLNHYEQLVKQEELNYEYIKSRYIETLANSMEYFCIILKNDNIIGFLKGRLEIKNKLESWLMALYMKNEFNRYKGDVLGIFEEYLANLYRVNTFNVVINEDNSEFWIENGYLFNRKMNYTDGYLNSHIYTKRRGG